MIHVTHHAVQRFQERVANWPEDRVRAALSSPLVHKAAEFGAHYIRLGTGQRIVIEDGAVITVLQANPGHKPTRAMRGEG
jgi:hypothetical protein